MSRRLTRCSVQGAVGPMRLKRCVNERGPAVAFRAAGLAGRVVVTGNRPNPPLLSNQSVVSPGCFLVIQLLT